MFVRLPRVEMIKNLKKNRRRQFITFHQETKVSSMIEAPQTETGFKPVVTSSAVGTEKREMEADYICDCAS